jgi:GntR family transcriptional regulator
MISELVISQSDKRPMYFQIMEQIKEKIAVGDWTKGQSIPSIRQLAVDLGVSVITVKRAYLELEREGIIVTHHGRGSHVAQDSDLGTRIREQELDQHLEQAARIGTQLGLSSADLEARLRATCARLVTGLAETAETKEEYA